MSAPRLNNRYNGMPEQEDFFSLSRHYQNYFIYQCMHQGLPVSRLGEDGIPKQEALCFKTIHSLGFSLDSTRAINNEEEGPSRYEYFVSFMGLLGAQGVLPQHYIKLSLERIKKGDFALSEFIGLFEHRLISLYFKALGKYKLPVQFQDNNGDEHDNFSRALNSFANASGHNPAQLYYSGHYARRNRPAINLQSLLAELLGVKVVVESMQGSWLPIREQDRCRTGRNGRNHHLGSGVILGKRYWDIQSTIVIALYDIDMSVFQSLQADKPAYRLLVAAVSAYVPVHIRTFFRFHIQCSQQQTKPLGKQLKLGGNAWLMSQKNSCLVAKRLMQRH